MIFKQLILTNFKSHQHNIINFNSGVTLIIGENGAGKSTILEAISYALYKKYTGDKIDDLIRTNQNTMTVTLTFISNGTEYTITRKRTNQQTKATLQKQGTTIAEGDKTVNQHIQEILDMDSELFLNTTYIRQGEIANLISKSPAERKQLIAKLLKLEELEKTYKYEAQVELTTGGDYGYTFRVMPKHEMLVDSENMNLIKFFRFFNK